jgi:prolyl-tRNA synthetase
MTHGDDDGLVLPPAIAPSQVVIVPILRGDSSAAVLAYAREVAAALTGPGGIDPDRVLVETSEQRSADLRWSYIKKGAPVIVEVGPRDLAGRTVSYRVRLDHRTLRTAGFGDALGAMTGALREVHEGLLQQARTRLREGIHTGISTLAEMEQFFRDRRGFVLGAWCGEPDCEALLKPLAVSIRCLPQHLEAPEGTCIVDGRPRRFSALFGQSY